MAAVTVRAFGALRELVPAPTTVEADDVAGVLAVLAAAHGEEFTRRMARSTVVVADEPREHDDRRPLVDGVEVVLLPPFAGG